MSGAAVTLCLWAGCAHPTQAGWGWGARGGVSEVSSVVGKPHSYRESGVPLVCNLVFPVGGLCSPRDPALTDYDHCCAWQESSGALLPVSGWQN